MISYWPLLFEWTSSFPSWMNSVVCLWILYVMSRSNPVICYIHIITRFCHVQCCTLNVHSSIYFCHAPLSTNDLQYYFWFLSCTSLYKWLSILFLVFVMQIFVWMTIHIVIGFCHAHIYTNDYPYSSGFS